MHLDFMKEKDHHPLQKTNTSLGDSLDRIDANEEEE